MRRRRFLSNAAIGVGSLAGGSIRAAAQAANDRIDSAVVPGMSVGEKVGRPVRIVSIAFQDSAPLGQIVERVDEEGSRGADVIILPELCRGQNRSSEESLEGPTVTAMATLAKRHKTYIAVPIDRRDGGRRLNSVVLVDRTGHVACVYDKVFPYWSEYDVHPPADPGDSVQVFHADFGRVGFATCFDANFPEVWRRLSDQGAELVLWPSAYSGGRSLQAHAINHHYYIVTCSQTPDCIVYDITGDQLFYRRAQDFSIGRVTLDLDRGIYHENLNISKRDRLLRDHPHEVEQENWMHLEQWFILRAKRPGVSARELAREYGIEELRHYLERSRVAIDGRRGWEFEESVVFPNKSIAALRTLASEAES
jgi:predicted amidohydrolase